MTENVQDTPRVDTPETQGPPTPQVSGASSEQASPQTGSVDAVVAEVLKRLDPSLDAKVDQRFKKVSDPRFADVQKVSEYLKASGGNVEQAARNMLLDEMIENQQKVPQGPSGNVSEGEANAQIEAQTTLILDGAGIAYNDPRYMALYEQYKDRISSPSTWENVLKTAVDTWKKQDTPRPAALVPEGRSAPPPASLQAEYDEAASKIRQGDIMGLANLKAEFRKKGLDVW